MHERNQRLKEEKAARFKELKEDMMKAKQKKQEQKDKEADEDWNIAQEQEEMEKKKIEEESALRYRHIYLSVFDFQVFNIIIYHHKIIL